MTKIYPEIERLNKLKDQYGFSISVDGFDVLDGKSYYPKVVFFMGGNSYRLYVDDEYEDFNIPNPVLHLCLVLKELEGYRFTPKYDVWCKERFLSPDSPQVRAAFVQLGEVYKQIHDLLGAVDSIISDFDFELNAGAAQALRAADNS